MTGKPLPRRSFPYRVKATDSPTGDGGDAGMAVVEFVLLVVLVMVPLAYGAATLSKVHSATFAVVTAAREAGRAYATADTVEQAGRRAQVAAQIALADHGLPAPHVVITCIDGSCLAPGSAVTVQVSTDVAIPLMPHSDGRGSIPVQAVHSVPIDRYRQS